MSAAKAGNGSSSAAAGPPRKIKQIALAWVVVYPLVTVLNLWVTPNLGFIPRPFRGMLVVLAMATVLTFVLPWANRRAATWLAR